MSLNATKYRLWCVTEDTYVYPLREEGEAVPTTCPNDTNHTVSGTAIPIIASDPVPTYKLQEEESGKETNGGFKSKTLRIDALANQTTSVKTWEPYSISALAVEYISEEIHRGDCITLSVGPDTITGAIIAPVSPATAWTSQNYTTDQAVTWTHPIYGERTYTCILDTVSNEVPSNVTYWRHGLAISVSPTVLQYGLNGKYIKLFDGVNQDSVDRIISVDLDNDKIYVETSPTNSFSPLSPTYIQQTTYIVKDFEISGPGERVIGQSKVGASHIPTDTIIQLEYVNHSPDTDKVFVGTVEYLE